MARASASAPSCEGAASSPARRAGVGTAGRVVALSLAAWGAVALQAAGVRARVPDAALYGGVATLAAPDDPLRAFSGPGSLAFLEGSRIGVSLTVRDGQVGSVPAFVHGAAVVSGHAGQGSGFFVSHAGRPAAGEPKRGVTELSLGYLAAGRLLPTVGVGASVYYRRVRDGDASAPEARDDHYLGVQGGLLAALADGLVVGARLDGLELPPQPSPAGPAEPGASPRPTLSLGVAYQASSFFVVEADLTDALGAGEGRVARIEARLYPGLPVGLRLGVSQALGPGGEVGWLAGLVAEAPGGRWALAFDFLGGEPYGGVAQVGAIVVRM